MFQRTKAALTDKIARVVLRSLSVPQVEAKLVDILASALRQDDDLKASLWLATQYRPRVPECHWARRPNSVDEARYEAATRETAEYVTAHMSGVPSFAHPYHVLNFCMDRLQQDGLVLEFGVFSGASLNHIAGQTERRVHGFDSFQGLPEAWDSARAGHFDLGGKLPEVAANAELHCGWFEDTLPGFIAEHPDPVAFLHIDCDLYSSTRTVLYALEQQITAGTMIVFDEYMNYPTWREHEFRAFQEFVSDTRKQYEYIAYADKGYSAAVRICA